MKTIHISQFFACSSVSLSVELQYIVELAKYLRDYDAVLSVDGVDFDDVLRKSRYWDYFRVALEDGWIADCTAEDTEITLLSPINYDRPFKNVKFVETQVRYDDEDAQKRRFDAEYNYRTPIVTEIVFAEKTYQFWRWNLGAKLIVNNTALNSADSESAWISMVAYVAVQRLFNGTPQNLLIEITGSIAKTYMVLSNFMLLMAETKACSSWCYYVFDESVTRDMINNLGYQAWYMKGLELGELNRWYTPVEKQFYMNKLDLMVGDVVFLYERRYGQKLDYLKSIEGFHVAVIENINADGVEFTVVNNKKTKSQGEVDYADFTMVTKQMYGFTNPFSRPNVSRVKYSWADLGVEYAMHGERYFITACNNDDYKEQFIGDEHNRLKVQLPAIELTYWILRDYGIEFDELRFVEKYIKEEPLYDMFQRTGTIPDKYIIKESR